MKCSKEIAKKIEKYQKKLDEANDLYFEIESYFIKELGAEGFISPFITDEPKGELQDEDEYCYQRCLGEDWYSGSYYHKIEGSKKYAGYYFEL